MNRLLWRRFVRQESPVRDTRNLLPPKRIDSP